MAYDLNTASRAGTANQSRGSPGADVPHFFRFLLAEPLRVRCLQSLFSVGARSKDTCLRLRLSATMVFILSTHMGLQESFIHAGWL